MKYARNDTHYLLYIYDKLRVTLIEKGDGQANLLKAVYDMSKTVCGRVRALSCLRPVFWFPSKV